MKLLKLFGFALLVSSVQTAFADPPTDRYVQALKTQREAIAPRKSELIVLPNKLKLFVVSDPLAKKSSLSVRVGVGFFADPVEYRGLAHYMEHVLFLGSDKYPNTDEFMGFMSAHQGDTNAYTEDLNTNFHLTIPVESFPEAVDRLAQFFISPKFDARLIGQELQSIQSEYEKNISNAEWRMDYLSRLTILPTHPRYYSFQGNLDTLGKIPRATMLDFYNRYYSANNMTAVLISSLPLPTLKKLGRSIFSQVKNRDVEVPRYPALVDFKVTTPQLFLGKVDQDEYILQLNYLFAPVNQDYWMTKALTLLSQQLTDMREGSLGNYLKSKGWLSEFSGYPDIQSAVYSALTLELQLTPEGYKHWSEIASGILAYIEQLKKMGLKAPLFDNEQRSGELNYLFGTKDTLTEAISFTDLLTTYPADQLNERDMLIPLVSDTIFQTAIDKLTLANLNVYMFAPDVVGDKTADYYDLSYKALLLADQRWAIDPKPFADFSPIEPQTNPFLPKDLSMITEQDELPVSISRTALVSTLQMRENQFKRPQVNVLLRFQTGPNVTLSEEDALLMELYTKYVDQELGTWAYTPKQTGYVYDLLPTQSGFTLSFNGYSDRVGYYMQEFFNRLFALKIESAAFNRMLDEAKRDVGNLELNDSYEQARWMKELVWNPYTYSDKMLPTLLDSMSQAKLEDFQRRLFSSGHLDIMNFGNLTKAQALGISTMVENAFPTRATADLKKTSVVETPLGTSAYLATRPGDNNTWYSEFQFGPLTAVNQAQVLMIDALLATPFYSYMRTEKQYGYVVFSWAVKHRPYSSMQFLVQSKVPSVDVAKDGRRYLKEDFLPALRKMSKEEFLGVKGSLLTSLKVSPTSFDEKWAPVKDGFLTESGFVLNSSTAAEVERLTQKQVIKIFENRILSATRREFSLYLDTTADGKATPTLPTGEIPISSFEEYRKSAGRLKF